MRGLSGGGGLGAPTPPLKQEPPISQDLSGTLPNLNYGQAVGDFTGAGHDQLAYAQDGQLKIANVNKFGGQVVRSSPDRPDGNAQRRLRTFMPPRSGRCWQSST